MSRVLFSCAFLLLSAFSGVARTAAPAILADQGEARYPIVIPQEASEATEQNAERLAEYLGKITGATFRIERGDGSSGIVLGPQSAFSALPTTMEFSPDDPQRQEDYLIHSHPQGILLVGASDTAARNAMWDLLHRLGYRHYSPGDVWEHIPSIPRAEIAVSSEEKPSYAMRAIWPSGGTYPERSKLLEEWRERNRLASSFYINAGHSYDTFIRRNQEQFDANPDWYALVNGERRGPKINIANPEVRRAFVEFSLDQLRKRPEQISVSADPSDGGGWDESEEAKAIGSPSTQAILLANEVAEALAQESPKRYVGLYAYNEHSEPPQIRVHENVFVLVATSFRNTLLTLQEQMQGWQKQGAALGIRDYLSYAAANYDVPARCHSDHEQAFAKNLKNYHDWGARLYSGEASDNWGINGFLYYAMSRVLWDVNDTDFLKDFREEFLVNCFGPLADTVRPYYEALGSKNNPVLAPGFFHRLYSIIEAARATKPVEAVVRRLDDMTLYVRYLELHYQYTSTLGAGRRAAMLEMFEHLYRSRMHSVNQARAIIRDLSGRDLSVKFTDEERKVLRRGEVPGGGGELYTQAEIASMSAVGLENNEALPFTPVNFSSDLVPAGALLEEDANVEPGSLGHQSGHSILYYTWAEKAGEEWEIKVDHSAKDSRQADVISVRVEIWSPLNPVIEPVNFTRTEIAKGDIKAIKVKSSYAGLHWVVISGARWLPLALDPTKKWTMTSSNEISSSQGNASPSDVYFYVPKGVTVLGAHVPGRGTLFDPSGQKVMDLDKDGYISIDVDPGYDGRLWKVRQIRGGSFLLLTAPPYFAASPDQLLLPKEVVEKDSAP